MEPIQRSRLEKIKKEMLYYSYSFLFVLDTKANIILQHVYDLIFFLYYFGLQTFFSNTLFISYIPRCLYFQEFRGPTLQLVL